jgi:hypothetical protein
VHPSRRYDIHPPLFSPVDLTFPFPPLPLHSSHRLGPHTLVASLYLAEDIKTLPYDNTPKSIPSHYISSVDMSFEDKKDYSGEKTDVLPALETGNYDHGDGINAFGQRKDEKLAPALKPRHMAMISIGGVIGTGLFLGTGSALHGGGPLGLFLGYALMGSVTYCMMQCLGEMLSYLPIAGGHIKLAERFVGKPLSLALGE